MVDMDVGSKYSLSLVLVAALVVSASFIVGFIVLIGGEKPFISALDSRSITRRVCLVFVITTLVSVFAPGFVAFWSNVFVREQMQEAIKTKYLEFYQYSSNTLTGKWVLRVAQEDRDSLSNAIELLDTSHFETNIVGTNGILKMPNRAANPELVSFYPYLFSSLNGMAPPLIFCFGVLLVAMWPIPKEVTKWLQDARPWLKTFWQAPTFWRWFFVSFCLSILCHLPVWVRNFWPLNDGRFVYAYSNWDISRRSFFATEAVDTIYLMFIILTWAKWLRILYKFRPKRQGNAFRYATNPKVLKTLSQFYVQWQMASVLIAVPFLGITFFYYEHILFGTNDHRYIPQAITSHLLWAATWIILSLRLLGEHYKWVTAKMEALAQCKCDPSKLKEWTKLFDKLRPYSTTNLVVSAFVSAIAFVAPAFHLIFENFHFGTR